MKPISILLIIGLLSISAFSQGNRTTKDDEDAYYSTATIKGHVTILNHPTLGKTAGTSTFILFQRTDCPRAAVGTWTDLNGDYEIRLSAGEYRLIVREGTQQGHTKDCLAPGQQRKVDTGPAGTIYNLNIELVVPKQ